ncbi:hypothetical protein DFS33DRAFT_1270906 [Desarmillaria ectypa]|nr:hypothetical protein DFS33DRAFT_1270906 [Desarmillaria ectypa]
MAHKMVKTFEGLWVKPQKWGEKMHGEYFSSLSSRPTGCSGLTKGYPLVKISARHTFAEQPTYTAFLGAPMLRSITFDVNYWDEEEDDVLLQWSKITSIDTDYGKDWLFGMTFLLLIELNVLFEFTRDPPCIDRIVDVVRILAGIQRLYLIMQARDATCPSPRLIMDTLLEEMKLEEFLPGLTFLRFIWTFHWGDHDEYDPDFAEDRNDK